MSKGRGQKAELRATFRVFCQNPPCSIRAAEVARLIVVMVQARHTVKSSLMVAPHEPTSEACEPTCSPIRVRPGASRHGS